MRANRKAIKFQLDKTKHTIEKMYSIYQSRLIDVHKISTEYAKDIENYSKKINDSEKAKDKKCVCKNGCNFCCKQAIGITKTEFISIIPILNSLDVQTKSIIKLQNEQVLHVIEDNNISCIGSTDKTMQGKYFNLNLMCPLNLNGSCIVYQDRPAPCWAYRVYDNNIECNKRFDIDNSMTYYEFMDAETLHLKDININEDFNLFLLPYALKQWYFD